MFKKSFFNPSSAMMLALAKRCGVVYSKRHVNFGSVRTIGPPAEIMQSAVSRLNSPACLADGFDMASFLRSPSA